MARFVTPTDHTEVTRCVKALASAFDKVPCTNSFSIESGQSVYEYVDVTVRSSLRRPGGALVEAGDASAVALWELPYSSDNATTTSPSSGSTDKNPEEMKPTEGVLSPVKKEWKEVVRRAKEKHIGINKSRSEWRINPHYHLDFLARNPHVPRVEGALSAVVLPFLGRAEQDELNVWLEATSPDIVPLYEYFGFRVVEEITVGVGTFDGHGKAKEGGEGVKAWLMLIDNRGKV